MRGRTPRWRWVGAGACALLAAGALAAALAWDDIFESAMSSQVALSPTSRAFEDWRAPSMPLFFEVFLFNWTNADRFPAEIPHMEQLGPYRFREYREHINVTWHPDNSSIGYRTQRRWHFDPSSNGSLTDIVNTLDVVSWSAIYLKRQKSFLEQKLLSLMLFSHKIFVTKTAGELLFDGYDDVLMVLGSTMDASERGGAPAMDKFGWFYQRNNSMDTDGYMEVTTGQDGSLPGQILRWNHMDHIPYYDGKCSHLQGSAGEFLPRNLTKDSKLTIFMPDLCRTMHMDYSESGKFDEFDGLSYHKYEFTERSFDNSTASPSNTCFCNGECLWGGVMNVSACRYGSPIFLSLPHFLHGDPRLRELVSGMQPDEKKHSFYFAVEPKLGIPLDVAARFQINVFLEPNPNMALYEKIPTMLLPIFWVQQRVQIEDEVALELRTVRTIRDWGPTFCAGAAFVFIVLAAMATCCTKTKTKYVAPIDITSEKPKDEAEMKLYPKLIALDDNQIQILLAKTDNLQ